MLNGSSVQTGYTRDKQGRETTAKAALLWLFAFLLLLCFYVVLCCNVVDLSIKKNCLSRTNSSQQHCCTTQIMMMCFVCYANYVLCMLQQHRESQFSVRTYFFRIIVNLLLGLYACTFWSSSVPHSSVS